LGNADGLDCCLHVVDANDASAVEDGGGDGGHGAVETIFGGGGCAVLVREDAADEGFSRRADQEWIVRKGVDELIQLRDQLEVLFLALAETDSGIDYDRIALYTSTFGHVDTRAEAVCDFLHDVGDWRQAMHGRGCTARMHQHQPGAGTRHGVGNVEVKTKRGDVVDDCGARIECCSCDFGFRCVDRERSAGSNSQSLNHGDDTLDLFFDRNRLAARTRRFTTDVDDIGALGDHLLGTGHRAV